MSAPFPTEKCDIMETSKLFTKHDVLWFSPKSTNKDDSCQLKKFLTFLHYSRLHPPYHFAYVSKEGNLLPNISLKDNLFLESPVQSLNSSPEAEWNKLLRQSGNIHLTELLGEINNIDLPPSEASISDRKITCFIKALLMPVNFIFLEDPEHGVSEFLSKKFIEATLYKCRTEKTPLFLSGQKLDLWTPFITMTVERPTLLDFRISSYRGTAREDGSVLNFRNVLTDHKKAA